MTIAVTALDLEQDLRARVQAVATATFLPFTLDPAAIVPYLSEAEGLLVDNQTFIGKEVFAAAPRLRVVAGLGVGFDRFDVDEATRRGIAVCNTPGVVSVATAELTIGAIFVLSRRLMDNARFALTGGWSRGEAPVPFGNDVGGKVLGIVGFGRIGNEVATRAHALGMRVLYHDIVQIAGVDARVGAEYREFDALLGESDFVTLHVDLNPQSRHLMSDREFALMKRSAYLLNMSRGAVVDQAALARALQAGAIAGAAVDVLEVEPPAHDEPLLGLPNLVLFPHIGTATVETRRAMRSLAVDNLVAVLAGGRPPACVNPAVLG